MDLLIESTKEFEQDLQVFSQPEKSLIVKKMNHFFKIILIDKDSLFQTGTLKQLPEIQLNNNYDSSLYSLIINNEVRVILTIDDDPIFDRIIITLFRVVNSAEASKAYSVVAKSLYKDLILNREEVEVQAS